MPNLQFVLKRGTFLYETKQATECTVQYDVHVDLGFEMVGTSQNRLKGLITDFLKIKHGH